MNIYKAYAEDQANKETYDTIQTGEQYYGMKPEYRKIKIGMNEGKIAVRIVNTKEKIVSSNTAFISIDDYANRPEAGKEKNEARWAFELCGVTY